jgi:hypothetical protein
VLSALSAQYLALWLSHTWMEKPWHLPCSFPVALGLPAALSALVSLLLPFPVAPQLAPLRWGQRRARPSVPALAANLLESLTALQQPSPRAQSGSFWRAPRPATLRSSQALGLLKMRTGSPSSQGSRCGFQTIALTLRRPVHRPAPSPMRPHPVGV